MHNSARTYHITAISFVSCRYIFSFSKLLIPLEFFTKFLPGHSWWYLVISIIITWHGNQWQQRSSLSAIINSHSNSIYMRQWRDLISLTWPIITLTRKHRVTGSLTVTRYVKLYAVLVLQNITHVCYWYLVSLKEKRSELDLNRNTEIWQRTITYNIAHSVLQI